MVSMYFNDGEIKFPSKALLTLVLLFSCSIFDITLLLLCAEKEDSVISPTLINYHLPSAAYAGSIYYACFTCFT